MMKQSKTLSAPDLRPPYRLILITAFLVPAVNNLTFGWGMLFCAYFSMNSPLLSGLRIALEILFQVVRAAALACTFMTIGFWAGKKGFLPAVKPTCAAVLSGACASAVGLGVYALMLLWGLTDSVATFSEQFGPYALSALFDLLILLLIEAAVIVFFSLVASNKGRERMLAARSPFMITAYILFGVYTALMMTGAISSVQAYAANSADKNFFVYCILPFLTYLLCGGAMVLAGSMFRSVLYRYFYEKRTERGGRGETEKPGVREDDGKEERGENE